MALFTVLKALVDDNINTNGIQAITGAIHNDVMNELIDAVGAAQVYVNPATTDNPGTPANNRAYIALPGTYTNFGGLTVTAPLGVLSWDGTSWTVTQLPFPADYDYSECQTSSALSASTPYTTVNVEMLNGGVIGTAGQWVKIINRRTGAYEFLQLAANVDVIDTSITFVSYTTISAFPIGSVIEINPTSHMMWHAKELFGDGTNDYVTLPSDWRTLPAACVNPDVWLQLMIVEINSTPARWTTSQVDDFDYGLNVSDRLKLETANILTVNDRVTVKYFQPRKL